ncbi:hypothetical protein [Sphingomonas oligoaromativorans]|uniref:hypothetical protein n=1 Tax=Sphingomonas oligoaromativorans TaxID=575322 RepID=UPI0014212CB3|nr:hypothetical protein [Sphingomonas oligoaromativorans]NIJ31839.1 hypothetical protein [Sphingomonas oligoaromativorans]
MNIIHYALVGIGLCISSAGNAQVVATSIKSAQLSKIVINPDIPKANQHVKSGSICLWAGSPINFGSQERTLNYERFDRLFSTALNAHGFKAIAKSADMFEGEGNSAKPDFLVGATLRPQTVNVCDSIGGLKGAIAISVEWQIYDRSKQQVVETVTTEGTGQSLKFQASGLNLIIDQAFSAAAVALISQGVIQKYLGTPGSSSVIQ